MEEIRELKLSIVMPVYNEGVNLKSMLKILRATVDLPHEVCVVYDSLADDSIPVIEAMKGEYPHLRSIHNERGRGVAHAIQSGVSVAQGEYVLILAADDIGPLLAVDEMVALMDEGCDLVSATRYAYGGRVFGGAITGRIFSFVANRLFYFLAGSSLTDSTIGIKMLRRSLFNHLTFEAKSVGWVIAFELAIKAQLAGWRLGEVPIISVNRFYGGKSSFNLGPWLMEYSKWFLKGLFEIYRSGKWEYRAALKIPQKLTVERKKQV